jgi:hypothetical protein
MPSDRPTLDYAPPPKRLSAWEILGWSFWLAHMISLSVIGLSLAIFATVMIWQGPSADKVSGLIFLATGSVMVALAALGFNAARKGLFPPATGAD